MNTKFYQSFLWLLIPAIGAIIVPSLENGQVVNLLNWHTLEAVVAASLLAAYRVYLNYNNPDDPRYGKTK